MSDKPGQTADGPNNADASQTSDQPRGPVSRRQVLKGAIATGPVILTATSRPAWATLKPKSCSEASVMSLNPSGREPCEGNEGCSPGFWAEHQGLWGNLTNNLYHYTDLFSTVFGKPAFIDPNTSMSLTLGEVILLRAQGQNETDRAAAMLPALCVPSNPNQVRNKKNLLIALGFHSVAGILNAASQVDYGPGDGSSWSSLDVIAMFQAAYMSCDFESTKDDLDFANNQYCPIDAHGRPLT